jgi:GxxExxY protein
VALADLGHINDVTGKVIGAAVEVHKALGPGLLESAYLACMDVELQERGLLVQVQQDLPLTYKQLVLDKAFRVDLIVDRCVVVEVKCVTLLTQVHVAQLLTYLKLTGCSAGLLINFHVPVIKQGIRRVLNLRPSPCRP